MAGLSPRKSPQQARAVATRDAILEAAAQVLRAGGLAAFNTNAVAQRAGVSIGSLYQYFPNKDALMAGLIARQQGRQFASVAAAMAVLDVSSPETAIRALVRAAMQHHVDDPLLASAIDHEEARLPVDSIVAAELGRIGAALTGLLQRLMPDAQPDHIARAARTLPALVRATVDAWANLSPPQIQTAEDEAVRAVLGYLART